MIIRLFMITLILVLGGCDQPLKEPEKVDPIYSDLEGNLKKAETALAQEQKALETAKKDWEKLGPREPTRKRAEREYYEKEKKVERLRQMADYHKLLLDRRRVYVKQAYMKAYRAKQPWPDPKEVAEYETNKRLKAAPRSWDARVPKLSKGPAEQPREQNSSGEHH